MLRPQILIEVRNWSLLSSQKCSSHFIGIWKCYIHFSNSILLQNFFQHFCWRFFLQAPQTRLRRLVNQNKQQILGKFLWEIQIRKIKITISYVNEITWTFLWQYLRSKHIIYQNLEENQEIKNILVDIPQTGMRVIA